MNMFIKITLIIFFNIIFSQKLMIPMDTTQSDHLKAYGLTFWMLENDINVDWILNYRGGSFMVDSSDLIMRESTIRGVTYELISSNGLINLFL